MSFAVITHDMCRARELTPGRLHIVTSVLDAPEFITALRHQARSATEEEILRAHSQDYLDALMSEFSEENAAKSEEDDAHEPGALETARLAAGAVCQAVDLVMAGEARSAFCAIRPSGHYCRQGGDAGICAMNNVALGAFHALRGYDLGKVAIVDFDAHRGFGTEDICQHEPRILYCTSCQEHIGPAGEESAPGTRDNIIRAPLPAGAGGRQFRAAWRDTLLPAIEAHEPDVLFLSAGFDGHWRDPLSELALNEADFAWLTSRLCDIAEQFCAGRVVSALEGGYDPEGLAASAAAHIRVLMERSG